MDEFMIAIFEGDCDKVEQFLKSGRDPNICDFYERTALQLAVEGGNVQVVRMLLDSGAEINARGVGGYTALHLSVGNTLDSVVQSDTPPTLDQLAIMECLLEAGADLNLRDDAGENPVDISGIYKNSQITNLLNSHA